MAAQVIQMPRGAVSKVTTPIPVKPRTADEIVASLEAAAPELQGLALEEEKAGRLSDRTVERLAESGVFDIAIPIEYGGTALNVADQLRCYAAAGKIAGSTGWVVWVTTTHVRWVAMFGQQARDDVYGMTWEAPRISGVVAIGGSARARPVDGGYMLKGKWPFASGCRHTSWTFLSAAVEGAAGGPPEMILTLVPTAQLEILDDWAVSGMKATGSNTVQIVDEVFVPRYRTIGFIDALTENWAEPRYSQALYRNHFGAYTSIMSGATPLGIAKGALDYYRARLDKRAITATDYGIMSDAPVTHFQLVEATARIEAAELLLTRDAEEMDRRALADIPTDDLFRAKIRYDVALSVRECAEAVEMLHRGSGASTIHESNPMQRYARDIRVATVHGQFNYETCAEDYGRALCGKPLFGAPPPPV